jgi:molybdopterin-guanine dinucleotide biosynthesis protein A
MKTPAKLTGLLLAGGLSSRMGHDKATLLIDDQPLWARQMAVLRQLRPEAIFISARTSPDWAPPDAKVLLDTPPSRGPLSGIGAALSRMRGTHLLALGVDLLDMTSDHLAKLMEMTEPGRGVIPRHRDHLEPVAAIYPREAAALAQKALDLKDVSLQSFAGELLREGFLKEYAVAPDEAGLYVNLNTPEDLRSYKR